MDSYSVLILAFLPAIFGQLPNGWKACSRSAPDYDTCFIREVTNAINTILNGDKKLGSPSIDPLRLEEVVIPRHNSPVSIDLKFTGLDISGLKNFKIVEAKNDWKTAKGVITFPYANAQGDYKVDGKVLVLPIVGEGKCNFTFHDVELNIDVIWKQIEKSGKKYFQMEKFDTNIGTKRLYINLENLFNGDKALVLILISCLIATPRMFIGDNMNVFLDENWDKILEELRPALNKGLSQALTQISNIVLSKIPADQIDLP